MADLTRLDESSRRILFRIRDEMKGEGINGATLADAVRRLNDIRSIKVIDGMDG